MAASTPSAVDVDTIKSLRQKILGNVRLLDLKIIGSLATNDSTWTNATGEWDVYTVRFASGSKVKATLTLATLTPPISNRPVIDATPKPTRVEALQDMLALTNKLARLEGLGVVSSPNMATFRTIKHRNAGLNTGDDILDEELAENLARNSAAVKKASAGAKTKAAQSTKGKKRGPEVEEDVVQESGGKKRKRGDESTPVKQVGEVKKRKLAQD